MQAQCAPTPPRLNTSLLMEGGVAKQSPQHSSRTVPVQLPYSTRTVPVVKTYSSHTSSFTKGEPLHHHSLYTCMMYGNCVFSQRELYGYCTGTVRVLYGNCRNMEQRQKREEIEVSTYNYATTASKGEQEPNKDHCMGTVEIWSRGRKGRKSRYRPRITQQLCPRGSRSPIRTTVCEL